MAYEGYRAYGRTGADFVASVGEVSGEDVLQPGTGVLTVWPQETGGTQVTDLLDAAGAAITTVTIGANGVLPRFYAPDDITELWVDGGGPRTQLLPADLSGLGGGSGGPVSIDDVDGVSPFGASLVGATSAANARDALDAAEEDHTHAAGDVTSGTFDIARLPAGSTITVVQSGSWPARPTSRADVIVIWKGPGPSPSIVSSGTGGMRDGIDIRFITAS